MQGTSSVELDECMKLTEYDRYRKVDEMEWISYEYRYKFDDFAKHHKAEKKPESELTCRSEVPETHIP